MSMTSSARNGDESSIGVVRRASDSVSHDNEYLFAPFLDSLNVPLDFDVKRDRRGVAGRGLQDRKLRGLL